MGSPGYGDGKGYVLALDVGTGSLHCLLADCVARPIAAASAPMRYLTPEGCSPLAKEFEPQTVLDTLGGLVAQVLSSRGIRDSEVAAIGITSQRQGVVFLDDEGREVYCGPNIDLRAVFEGAAMDDDLGGEIYAVTGHFPSFLLAPARLRWFRDNRPLTYDNTRTILTVAGWLAYRLTGCLTSEPALEAEAGLLDIGTGERPHCLMDRLGVSPTLLPPLSAPGIATGALSQPMADRWGLKYGLPVTLAGPDTQCGLLGMGLREEGQAGAVIGWSGALQVLTSAPRLDSEMRTWQGCYPLEGLWVKESNLGDTGNSYRWLKDTLLGSTASFEDADALASETSAASEGVLAFLNAGPVSSFRAGLRMGGLMFPTPLSFQETTRGQLLRAALENIAYGVKASLDTLRELTCQDLETLHLGGGMSSGRTLTATLSGVLGLPIRRSTVPHVSARGAAMIAAVAATPSLTLQEAAEAAADDCEEVEPAAPSQIAQYEEYYRQWLHMYDRLEWAHD